jgi:hypothetical protein
MWDLNLLEVHASDFPLLEKSRAIRFQRNLFRIKEKSNKREFKPLACRSLYRRCPYSRSLVSRGGQLIMRWMKRWNFLRNIIKLPRRPLYTRANPSEATPMFVEGTSAVSAGGGRCHWACVVLTERELHPPTHCVPGTLPRSLRRLLVNVAPSMNILDPS